MSEKIPHLATKYLASLLRGILLNFILIPNLILASSLTTGDAASRATSQINVNSENTVIQNNSATAISNTGGNSSSGQVITGDATAVSEMNISNGKVEGRLEVEANGEKKELNIDKPGSYRLEIGNQATAEASSELKTQEDSTKPVTNQNSAKKGIAGYLERFFDFLLGFFKRS